MKKILQIFIPILCLFFSNSFRSQNPGVVQAKNGSGYAYINRDVCYHNGRYYSLGAREITCMDQNLNIVWTTSINSTNVGFSNASRIIITKDGNILCGGITTALPFNTYVIKLRTDGTVIFQREYSLPAQLLPSLQLTLFALSPGAGEDEGFILGGGACGHSNLLIKCDKNGNIEWAKHHLIPGGSGVQGIYAENEGYVITSTYSENSLSGTMIWLADVNGDPQWSHSLLTPFGLAPYYPKIRKLSSGKLAFICSSSEASGPAYICSLDPNGTNIDLRKISTYKQIGLHDLSEDMNGDLVLSGYVRAVPQNDPNAQRSLCLKLNANNTIAWARQSKMLSVVSPVLNVAHKTSSGKFSMFGDGAIIATVDQMGNGLCTSDSMLMNASSETFTETFPGILNTTSRILMDSLHYETEFVSLNKIELCNTIGIEEVPNAIQNLKVYPNPNNGIFKLQLTDGFNEGEFLLYDQLGKKVFGLKISYGLNEISANQLSSGIYYFKVIQNSSLFATGKFSVE